MTARQTELEKSIKASEKLDKEIEDLLKENEAKRNAIAEEQQKKAVAEGIASKQLQIAQLQAESARLDVKMNEVASKPSAEEATESVASPLAAARAEMEALQQRASADTTTTETAVTVVTPEQLESDTKEK